VKVLIDTDFILDLLLDREPFAQSAAVILSLCEKKILHGHVTPVTISNLYYVLRKDNSHKKVIEAIQKLIQIVDIAIMDKFCIEYALNSGFKDFEDALQNFTAQNHNIECLITRNTKDYKKSNLTVLTPDGFLEKYKI
jgi:predicted nucleic acid-binding protein